MVWKALVHKISGYVLNGREIYVQVWTFFMFEPLGHFSQNQAKTGQIFGLWKKLKKSVIFWRAFFSFLKSYKNLFIVFSSFFKTWHSINIFDRSLIDRVKKYKFFILFHFEKKVGIENFNSEIFYKKFLKIEFLTIIFNRVFINFIKIYSSWHAVRHSGGHPWGARRSRFDLEKGWKTFFNTFCFWKVFVFRCAEKSKTFFNFLKSWG